VQASHDSAFSPWKSIGIRQGNEHKLRSTLTEFRQDVQLKRLHHEEFQPKGPSPFTQGAGNFDDSLQASLLHNNPDPGLTGFKLKAWKKDQEDREKYQSIQNNLQQFYKGAYYPPVITNLDKKKEEYGELI
jgi:hypothetical protein